MSAKWDFSLTDFPLDKQKARAYIQLNFRDLLEGRGHTELLALWKIWLYLENDSRSCSRKRKTRADNRQKKAFALSWVTWRLFRQSRETGHHLSRENCFNKAVGLLEDLENHELSTIYRRRKKDERVFCMPEVWTEAINYRLVDLMDGLQKRSLVYYPYEPKNEADLAIFSNEIRLIQKILKRLRRTPKITQRNLCRALTIRLSELEPALSHLEGAHVISWDRQNKSISTDRWDPKDKRKFVWRLDSSWPRFGPRLQKGKVHKFSDYNRFAAEEWIRTGAARIR